MLCLALYAQTERLVVEGAGNDEEVGDVRSKRMIAASQSGRCEC